MNTIALAPSQQRRPANQRQLQQHFDTEYENVLWAIAEAKVPAPDYFAAHPECAAVVSMAGRNLTQLVADLDAIRRRIDLQGEIEERIAATNERDELLANRQQLEQEKAAAIAEFDAKLQRLGDEMAGPQRRLSNTRDALLHYERTAPAWLKGRLNEVGEELAKIDAELHAHGPIETTAPLGLKSIMQTTDKDERARLTKSYERKCSAYLDAKQEFDERRDVLLPAQKDLEQECAALQRAVLQLRPTLEDVKYEFSEFST